MADVAEIRAVLREHGHEPPDVGKLGGEWRDLYDEIQAGETEPDHPLGDAETTVTGAQLPPDPDAAATTADVPPAERRPRNVRKGRAPAASIKDRIKGRGKSRGGRSKTRHPRVPVDSLCEKVWSAVARALLPVDPPVSRCLAMSSPVAGVLLEDAVKGTIVDRGLQPLARMEERGKKVAALVMPPVLVAGLERAQQLPDQQRMMREAFLLPLLREALVLQIEVVGDKAAVFAERETARGPAEALADEMIQNIFSVPTDGPATSAEADEDAAARNAQAGMAGAGIG